MKKKVMGLILVLILVMSQVVSVFAIGSKTAVPESTDSAIIVTVGDHAFDAIADQLPAGMVDKMLGFNNSTATDVKSVLEQINVPASILQQLEGKEPITPFFDIREENAVKDANGKYKVTLSMSNLTRAVTKITVLHYSLVKNAWEALTPSAVDYDAKTITVAFDDLSPVIILAEVAQTPPTGDSTNILLWVGIGVAALCVMGVCFFMMKSKKKA